MAPEHLPAARAAPRAMGLRRRLRPSTRLGRIACWLALAFFAWFVLNLVIVQVQQTRLALPTLPLIIASWAGFATGLLAGVVALVAIIRDRERGILVFVAMLPLLVVATFLLGELLVPH